MVINGASTRETGGIGRLLLVPMALEIESNGRMGFETGNEGIRRGGAVGAESAAIEVIWHAKGLPEGREIEPDDLARRVGILENTGSVFSLESTPELLPSED